MSLKKRLLKILILILTLSVGIAVYNSYQDSRDEIQELFDAQLARMARFMLSMSQAGIAQVDTELFQKYLLENQLSFQRVDGNQLNPDNGHSYEVKMLFQIFDGTQKLILKSENAPEDMISTIDKGYTDVQWDGKHWRVFVIWNRLMEYKIFVAENYEVRNELVGKITTKVVIPFLILIPVLAWLLWFAVDHGLKPLVRVADAVKLLDVRNLKPLEIDSVPEEIEALVTGLDKLFVQVRESFNNERRFSADAAHELRTPLAGLRTHVQLLMGDKRAAEFKPVLQKIMKGVDRASHVVDQLLNLVKYEEGSMVPELKSLDLCQISRVVAADLAPFAIDKNIDLGVDEYSGAVVYGDAVAISMLIRNLLDNAIRYTQANGKVSVSFQRLPNEVILNVIDNGPGISKNQYDEVFKRFHRGEGHVLSGCGIGMAIVKEIADLHLATINMKKPEDHQGLHVEVRFNTN